MTKADDRNRLESMGFELKTLEEGQVADPNFEIWVGGDLEVQLFNDDRPMRARHKDSLQAVSLSHIFIE